jgi:hypothetical protein
VVAIGEFMPSKDKKRSSAARKGWLTRKANILKRSSAAKKGHRTRKRNAQQAKKYIRYHGRTVPKVPETAIIRTKYAKNDIEIVRRNGKTISIKITKPGRGKRKAKTYEYTSKKDLAAFDGLIRAATQLSLQFSRGNRKRVSSKQ